MVRQMSQYNLHLYGMIRTSREELGRKFLSVEAEAKSFFLLSVPTKMMILVP